MKTHLLKEGGSTENSASIGSVTRQMVRERAVELAIIDGRFPQDVSKSDWELAKQELNGDPGAHSNEAVLASAPESERWDPVPGSTGHKLPVSPSADEDDEGRSGHERLVDQGIARAERDQMVQARREADKAAQ